MIGMIEVKAFPFARNANTETAPLLTVKSTAPRCPTTPLTTSRSRNAVRFLAARGCCTPEPMGCPVESRVVIVSVASVSVGFSTAIAVL